ncbi:hypothetical protein UNDYM_2335 [Undibacterium sp. YM2]|uniref:LPO_1073/Vpar_1526 family protein n=1 Tax=Undibacterium sp. YM2 TaxID=2058625 RepID=UPI001331DBE4|nr:LPO_1073/Vpar_1526 family protein [Undibacterium sp. YM2]BBB66588.1 hypothetical protein UNDYM_2335 [Undibacterium sp. YM2]
MINSQSQNAGDSSTNMQAQHMVVNLVGIDEKRAREIYQEMILQSKREYTQEARNVANSRVTEFENRLMPKMAQVEGALEAFADPSFQLLLIEAQKAAASTERLADYDLLSELLIHRFQRGENRITRAGISLAVEIVDKISDEALLGLTVAHVVNTIIPNTGDIHQGLDVLNDFCKKLFYSELPKGQDWIDHLDILDAVRLNPFGGFRKLEEYYQEVLSGYVDLGIENNSANHNTAIEILNNNNLTQSILVEHALNSDFHRLCIPNKGKINELTATIQGTYEGRLVNIEQKLSDEHKQALNSIYDLYSNDGNKKQANVKSFMTEWDKRSNLKILREWWDNIPNGFSITSVGKVLAHSNAQRCDKTLPPLV